MHFEPDRLKRRIFQRSIALLILPCLLTGGLALLSGQANTADAKTPVQVLERPQGTGTPTPTETPPPSCALAWRVVSSPDPGDGDNALQGVAALSANDVWAVGYYFAGNLSKTLIMHWDGTEWAQVPSPNIGDDSNFLTRVTAVSTNDVWATGYYFGNLDASVSLILHWDGTQWIVVPSPNPGALGNFFNGIAAVASDDVWAVGQSYDGSGFSTLIIHWNGTQWTQVASPNPVNTDNRLRGVVALSANDVWAVGFYYATDRYETLVEHWDGTQWSIVPSPNIGTNSNLLRGLWAVSTNDMWAVGFYVEDPSGGYRTLVEHWDGSQWSIVPSPNPSAGLTYDYLNGVVALSANDVWAAGYYLDDTTSKTLVEHWDGTQWSIVPSPNNGAGASYLYGISAASPTDVWTVGNWVDTTLYRTLAERYSSPCGSPTPGATHTGTPESTPTRTPTRTPTNTPTNTASSTPTSTPTFSLTTTPTITLTPCTIQFSDVHPNDYFYEAVRHLYCSYAISGYADNTFRPSNITTRGQLCKIVVIAFCLCTRPPINPFNDVPWSHPFANYIASAYGHDVISGYECGGPGEPCPGLYFRPGASVTRGQLCKIVTLSARWPIYAPPEPTFIDVPASHPFYQYIETAHHYGVISGYSDSTFRPGNNATRGQVSKIIHLALTGP